ncbi:MAG: YitT family protein [Lachnospiraceae bacterium]|nr:YitT family protein [Lachnospiraceae bacterium]
MKDTAYDFAGAFLQALGVWCFIEPCMIAPGGVSGMAILINHLTKLPVGIMTLVLNIPLLASSYVCLNRRMTWKTIRTVLVMTLVLDGLVTPLIPQYVGDKLISSVFGGILVGVGMALIFMRDSTTGGGDILAKLLQKRFPYMHTGYALMMVDVVVIGSSVLVFGKLEAALYGLISMVATTQTIDALLYGMNKGAMVLIHSEKNREIADEIMERLNRGTTFFKSVGGYSKKEGETLLCVIDRKQFYLVKEIAYAHDPHAFVVVSETKETYGEGFLDGR